MKNNRRLAAILAVIMAFWLGGHTVAMAAAIPMPILPYIPPQKVELYDLLNNAFGLTRLNITDDAKRLAAYLDLYVRVMGAANADLIDKMIDGAQSSYKYKIKADLINGVQSVMNEQITTGYEEIITATPIDVQGTYNKLLQWQYITAQKLPYATYQNMYNTALSALGANILVLCTYITKGVDNTLVIGFVKNDATYTFHTKSQSVGGFSGLSSAWKRNGTNNAYPCIVYGQNLGGSWSRGNNNNSPWFGFENTCVATSIQYGTSGFTAYSYTTKGESYMRKATAQSSAITTALQNSDDIPITAESVITNGTLDRTKDVVITIPATRPVPAQGVSDLPQVQDELGVLPLPLTQDVAQTVTDLQAQSVATTGNAGDYALDLRNYFPFCLPFDIGNLLACFVADPQAPSFEWQFPTGYDAQNHAFTMQTFTIDLSMWDSVAYWLRKGELALFIVGLAVVTRQWFLRG